ncbi:hypothetical protein B0H14DRAFT_3514557 [Mycena olivaceomarginata]|nr:hypothetical protein B0H14DRAFT_3514557 [Mycena olivaceomarginata]
MIRGPTGAVHTNEAGGLQIPTVFYKSSASTTLPTAPAVPRHHQHASTSNTDASASQHPSPGRISFPTGRENGAQHAFAKRFVLGNTGGAPSTPAGAATAGPSTAGCLQRLAALVCAYKYAGVGALPLFTSGSPTQCELEQHARDTAALSFLLTMLLPTMLTAPAERDFNTDRILDALPTPSAVPDPSGAWQPPRRAVAAAIPFAYEHAGALAGCAVRARADEVVAIGEASGSVHERRELPPSSSSSRPMDAGVDALPALSAFLTRYLSSRPNPILVSHATSLTRLPL